uniref:Protein IQ-DOMAIN 1 n=2 Tax=Anthurium amnicola TaxID=1678845 RepID=A0A1D1Y823_9ARAE
MHGKQFQILYAANVSLCIPNLASSCLLFICLFSSPLLFGLCLVHMGSGDWFKTIISRKKTKPGKSKKTKDSATEEPNLSQSRSQSDKSFKCNSSPSLETGGVPCLPDEDAAATRIQTAFRCYKARGSLQSLRGAERLRVFTQRNSVQKQASTTLTYLRSWNKIQTEISARRNSMVVEGRIRQKKHENQLKLEAKLHGLEVDWCGGSETREVILARIQQRETAAVKRERAMAYAFSHQWRANSGLNHGHFVYELGRGNWGWSWMDRWIAARPWEPRLPTQSTSPKMVQPKSTNKSSRNSNSSSKTASTPLKPAASNGKRFTKKLSNSTAEVMVDVSEASSKPVKETTP